MLEMVPVWRQMLADMCGSLSLACWVIILLPQLLEQWRLKNADGIAIEFITAWFVGDVLNLLGSLWGGLRPNVVLLALWFCFSDTLLILSYHYYKSSSGGRIDEERQQHATTPLLEDRIEFPVGTQDKNNWLLSTGLPIIFVIVIATLSYAVSASAPSDQNTTVGLGPQILGYLSALLYLTARVPQIIQNHRRRSVDGLSIGFFALSVVGNLTYGAQILIYRADWQWVKPYIPWLLGSLGTIAQDGIILAQFHIYKRH